MNVCVLEIKGQACLDATATEKGSFFTCHIIRQSAEGLINLCRCEPFLLQETYFGFFAGTPHLQNTAFKGAPLQLGANSVRQALYTGSYKLRGDLQECWFKADTLTFG